MKIKEGPIRRIIPRLLLSLTLTLCFEAPVARAQATGCTDQALTLAEQHLTDTIAYTKTSKFPEGTNPANGNKWDLTDADHWTSGFFPGWIWYTYENTLNNSWMSRAQGQTDALLSQDTNADTHDIGFKILGSYGNAYRITRNPADMKVIQTAAGAMATSLYRPDAGVIESWPFYDSNHITVIVDNMMNLELLFFAAQNGGDPNWYKMAVSHAEKTMANHVRTYPGTTDLGTYHVVQYNKDKTVTIYKKFTVQGAGTETTWARGQAWAIYGFTMTYRYTKDPRFLDTAQRLANYFINRLPSDYVPYWDFSASGSAPRDSSAAAIAAAGLLELSNYAAAQTDKDRYRNTALNIQTSLSSPAYLATRAASDGILLHGSAHVPGNSEVDVSLIYGDYYFLQGCFRARSAPAAPTNLTATAASNGTINLAWTAESGPIRYSVKRSRTLAGPYTAIAPPPVLTNNYYSDTGLVAATTYYYVVSAIGVGGEGSDSSAVSATTEKAATTTSLVSSPNPSGFRQAVTFTATVNTGGPATPTGPVSFKDGTTNLGTATLSGGKATFSISTLAVGSHSLTAVYGGEANFSGSVSPAVTQTVTKAATSAGVTSSRNPSRHGNGVTFTAIVKSLTTGTPTGSVTLKDGGSALGTQALSHGKVSITKSTLAVGSHSITVIYNGDANYKASTSAVLTQKVNP